MSQAKPKNFAPFDASDWLIGIVVAQFNPQITNKLLAGTLTRAKDYKLNNIDTVKVAGSVEIPLVLQKMAQSGNYNALVALGCVVRGETPHFDYVCRFVTDGILQVQLDNQQPIAFGILTCDTQEQAKARAGLGGDYLDAVMHQAKEVKRL